MQKNGERREIMSGNNEGSGLKTIRYELKIIFKKRIAIGSGNRKRIEEILHDVLKSGELNEVKSDELFGVLVEELDERDRPGNCDDCPYLCPKDEDCMMDDLEDRCAGCSYHCKKCGGCAMRNDGTCGDGECKACHWSCPECGKCRHPEGEKLP